MYEALTIANRDSPPSTCARGLCMMTPLTRPQLPPVIMDNAFGIAPGEIMESLWPGGRKGWCGLDLTSGLASGTRSPYLPSRARETNPCL